ncbi:MAG: hypothetical protein DME93_13080 [Verrucomicrobia bacterium]|nr:MAG: hypothetical protein DME93_13080 [Verrucomicrobiota bacterium]
MAPCPSRSARSSSTSSLAPRNANPGLIQTCGHACTVIWQQSATTVGGFSDHVHVVTTLPRTLSQAQLIEQMKKTSSKWIKGVR